MPELRAAERHRRAGSYREAAPWRATPAGPESRAAKSSSRRGSRMSSLYIVVLNLFVEYVPKVVTESFTISIFTAVVLKLLIDAIARLEHRVRDWFKRREGSGWRAFGLVTMFSILFFSKFVVLEVIDIVFGDRVTLGGFIEVALLVLTMILARLGLTWAYRRLGEDSST